MDSLDQLHTIVQRAALLQAKDALASYGDAWAEATRDEAPEETGALKRSIRWVPTGDLSGELQMVAYGEYVDRGHAIVTRVGPALVRDARGRVGSKRVPPNPFIQRGAQEAGLVAHGSGYSTSLVRALRDAAVRGLARIFG